MTRAQIEAACELIDRAAVSRDPLAAISFLCRALRQTLTAMLPGDPPASDEHTPTVESLGVAMALDALYNTLNVDSLPAAVAEAQRLKSAYADIVDRLAAHVAHEMSVAKSVGQIRAATAVLDVLHPADSDAP